MDEQLRQAEQAFNAGPTPASAQAALSLGLRSGEPPASVLRWVLALERWDDHPEDLQELSARCVECLHSGFTYTGLETFSLGEVSHRIGVFDHAEGKCVLLPAGQVDLGFDPRTLEVSAEQELHLRAAIDGGDVLEWLQRIVGERFFTPIRRVDLEPFLIEMQATGFDDVAEELYEQEDLTAYRVGGFRLPTSDQWEFACAGGADTLFRWGHDCPLDQSPYAGEPFDLHRRPNAFGLHLPGNTYVTDLVVPEGVRGGDGGAFVHGRNPHYLAWLTLSSAYDASFSLFEQSGMRIGDCVPDVRLVHPVFDPPH